MPNVRANRPIVVGWHLGYAFEPKWRTAAMGPVERMVRPHTGHDERGVCESRVTASLAVFEPCEAGRFGELHGNSVRGPFA